MVCGWAVSYHARPLSGAPAMIAAILAAAALLIDAILGEPRRAHPLVAFGALATRVEQTLNRSHWSSASRRATGMVGLLVTVAPMAFMGWWLSQWPWTWAVEVIVLYLALGLQSLATHGRRVATALRRGDLPAARAALGMMVSRDTAHLEADGVAAGSVESLLENGNDAVFGALFWFFVAGAPGVIVYRLVNTLDAMWGYKTPRLAAFGWSAARLDDALNWIPARLTVLTYGLAAARPIAALRCAWRQGGRTESPNAGIVMAAGAGALGVRLGGPGRYHGAVRWRPRFGVGARADGAIIDQAIRLIRIGALLWVLVALFAGWWLC